VGRPHACPRNIPGTEEDLQRIPGNEMLVLSLRRRTEGTGPRSRRRIRPGAAAAPDTGHVEGAAIGSWICPEPTISYYKKNKRNQLMYVSTH
jgi:hypothetical protein